VICASARANRPRRTAQDVRDLPDRQVRPVAQHQHGPLTRGQLCQRPAEFREVVDFPERTCRLMIGLVACRWWRQFCFVPGAAVSIAERQVDQDPAGIGRRVIHRSHLVPPPCYSQKGLLDQVLGVPGISCHQVAGAE
jgi:hypothetical protein